MIRKLYLREAPAPAAKKAMTNIVKRGVDASPPAEKEWGDALMKAVDDFDIDVRPAGSGGKDAGAAKKASAVGKKPAAANAAKPVAGKPDAGYDPKVATRTSQASPKPADDDLDDDWFSGDAEQEAEPEKDKADVAGSSPEAPSAWGTGHKLPPRRSAGSELSTGGKGYDWTQGDPSHKPGPAWDEPDPDHPESANFHVGADDSEEEYKSPFGATGFGGSSWNEVPDWMRDQEKMPMPGGGSRRIPSSGGSTAAKGPSPVGKPWSEKDAAAVDPANATKKKGLLGRIFGRNK